MQQAAAGGHCENIRPPQSVVEPPRRVRRDRPRVRPSVRPVREFLVVSRTCAFVVFVRRGHVAPACCLSLRCDVNNLPRELIALSPRLFHGTTAGANNNNSTPPYPRNLINYLSPLPNPRTMS